MIEFELNRIIPTIIKVIGVGGGGSNAVNHMFRQGINGVEFLVCNTDAQALEISPVPRKIQLGPGLTQGRGAGSIPEVGKQAAIENIDELKNALKENTKMVSIQLFGSTGTMINDKIIISNEYNKEFESVRMQLKEKLVTLDVHKRKQLLMELLSIELNENLVL